MLRFWSSHRTAFTFYWRFKPRPLIYIRNPLKHVGLYFFKPCAEGPNKIYFEKKIIHFSALIIPVMLFVVSATTETGTAQGTGACRDSVSY